MELLLRCLIFAALAMVSHGQQVYATGFTAYRTASIVVTSGSVIIMDGVITNVHRDDAGTETTPYSSTTGIFTCPVNGLYYFHFTVRSDSLAVISAKLEHVATDGATVLGTYAQAKTASEGLDTAANAGFFRCNTGESARLVAPENGGLYGEAEKVISTFGGLLVYGIFS